LRTREWFAEELRKVGRKDVFECGKFLLADFGASGPAFVCPLGEERHFVAPIEAKRLRRDLCGLGIGTRREMELLVREIIRLREKR